MCICSYLRQLSYNVYILYVCSGVFICVAASVVFCYCSKYNQITGIKRLSTSTYVCTVYFMLFVHMYVCTYVHKLHMHVYVFTYVCSYVCMYIRLVYVCSVVSSWCQQVGQTLSVFRSIEHY